MKTKSSLFYAQVETGMIKHIYTQIHTYNTHS